MDVFILKLILTFIIGSLWVTYATIISERLGPKIGGLLAGVPSTTVIALFFIGWTQSAQVAADSTTVIPVVLGVNALLVALYIYLAKKNFYIAIFVSLFLWFTMSFILNFFHFNNLLVSVLLSLTGTVVSYVFVEYILRVKSQTGVTYKYSFQNLVFRGCISGTMISIAVVMAKIGGPILGGTFSTFPAVFFSTMIITYLSHGWSFSAAVMKVLMVSASLNVLVYAIAVRYLYPSLGLFTGTIVCFLISLMSAYGVFQCIKRVA